MEKRYRVLRFISFIYKLLAILVLIGAIIGAVAMVALVPRGGTIVVPTPPPAMTEEPGIEVTATVNGTNVAVQVPSIPGMSTFTSVPAIPAGPIGAVMVFIGGLLWALGLYAVGDFISLLVATEQNTRAGAEYNRQAALMMREVAKRLGGGTGNLGR